MICKNDTTKIKGIYQKSQSSKYIVYINTNKKRYALGRYTCKWDAICARKSAESKLGLITPANAISKKCTKCLKLKCFEKFGSDKSTKDGYAHNCKDCCNTHARNYRKTKIGLACRIYADQETRSWQRNDPPPEYTSSEFKKWLFNQPSFDLLFENWKKSGFQKMLAPSVDRKNDYLPYKFDNIQLMTWQENKAKYAHDSKNGINNKMNKPVIQLTKSGDFIAEFHSVIEAFRRTKVVRSNITKCCTGAVKSAGGFVWHYSA